MSWHSIRSHCIAFNYHNLKFNWCEIENCCRATLSVDQEMGNEDSGGEEKKNRFGMFAVVQL